MGEQRVVWRIVCDGNSITFGVGGLDYPRQLADLFYSDDIPVTNVGVSGKTVRDPNHDAKGVSVYIGGGLLLLILIIVLIVLLT